MFKKLMYFSGCDFGVAIAEAGWLKMFQMKSHIGITFFLHWGMPVSGTLGYSAAREQEARLKAVQYLLHFGL